MEFREVVEKVSVVFINCVPTADKLQDMKSEIFFSFSFFFPLTSQCYLIKVKVSERTVCVAY